MSYIDHASNIQCKITKVGWVVVVAWVVEYNFSFIATIIVTHIVFILKVV